MWIRIFLLRQWVPHDEGAFSDVAGRILRGEVPHRDFLDLYTGGLGYLNAFAWKLFGHNLAAFRYMLYLFVLGWLPALYYIATRFVPPLIAATLVVIGTAWSLPNYPAAVPSWYNLFFATWGTAALLRYTERPSRWWVFLAGVCGGLSVLIKVSGLFFVFAAALFLVYRNQQENGGGGDRMARLLRCSVAVAVLVVCVRILAGWLTPRTVVFFVAPVTIVVATLLGRELHALRSRSGGMADSFTSDMFVLAAGVAVSVASFLTIYLHGGLGAWVRGVFVLPALRLQFAQADPPPLWGIAVSAGVLLLCGMVATSRKLGVRAIGAAALFTALLVAYRQEAAFQSIWLSLSAAIPIATLVGAFIVLRGNERLFLLTAVTALCSLVQFPFSAPVYFCYIVPFVVLLVAATIATRPQVSSAGAIVVLAFFAFAGLALIDPGDIYTLGDHFEKPVLSGHLQATGAENLRILPQQAALYNAMIPVVVDHARGDFVFASPSAPEVYFLSGKRNPAHWTFDFFDEHATDPAFVHSMLEAHRINLVVINTTPDFDPAPTDEMMALYTRLYPHSQKFGRFEVRWR